MKQSYQKGLASPRTSLAAAAILVLFLVLMGQVFSYPLYTDAIYLEQGWELTRNDQVAESIDLSKYVFPTLHRGDRVTLRTVLPEIPFESTYMQIRVWSSTIDVLVDDTPCFQYGGEAYAAGQPVGGGYQWIPIPSNAAGKEIEIQLLSTENNSFTQFAPPMLYSSTGIVKDFIRQNSVMTVTGLFLTALGLVVMLFAAVLLLFRRDAIQLFWIALLSLDIGLWVLCRYGIFQMVSLSPRLNYYIEYICLYLTPPLGLLCVYAIQDEKGKRPLFTTILLAVNLLYVPVLILLHGFDILYIAEALRVCHMFILMTSISIFVYCFNRRHNGVERIKLLGVTVLAIFAVLDLVLFTWNNAVPRGTEGIQYSMAAIGAVLFILVLLINYGLASMQHFYAQAETAALEKLAYADALTGLANRARANVIMQEMDDQPKATCGMLLFDLNNLKETNDQHGHAVGDVLICAFSAILQKSFASLGTAARIGGDEFVVLFSATGKETVAAALMDMQQQIRDYNATAPIAPVSVAFGEAYSLELSDWSTEKLYRLADERMYLCKAEMKGERRRK